MKKVSGIFLAIILMSVLVLSGCASSTPSQPAPAPAVTSAPTPSSATSAPSAAAPKTLEFKLTSHAAPNGSDMQIIQKWADTIGEKSGGKVKINCYFGGTLAKPAEARAATEKRVVDIGFCVSSDTALQNPLTLLAEAPMMGFKNSKHATGVLSDLLKNYVPIQKEWQSVKILFSYLTAPRRVHMTKKVVRLPSDIKGAKIIGSGVSAEAVQLLGGAPVVVGPPDWYTSLNSGLAEGQITAFYFIEAMKTSPLLLYNTIGMDLGYTNNGLYMNWDSWNSLPPDLQKLLDNELNPWALDQFTSLFDNSETNLITDFKKSGHTVTTLNDDEAKQWANAVSALAQKLISERTAKGLPAQETYDLVVQTAKKTADKY
jgi:TRAP-type C4-dicarboxylate transport system substrate-binding protein